MSKKDIHDYSDIINIKRPTFSRYKKMSMHDRAAQFAPFAAVTGHKSALYEKARETESRKIIDENVREEINRTLNFISHNIELDIYVKIRHFVEDRKKQGGKYIFTKGNVSKLDDFNKCIIINKNIKILFDDIYSIETTKKE